MKNPKTAKYAEFYCQALKVVNYNSLCFSNFESTLRTLLFYWFLIQPYKLRKYFLIAFSFHIMSMEKFV